MRKNLKFAGYATVFALSFCFTACGSDNNEVDGGAVPQEKMYVWTSNGGIKACNQILFDNGKELLTGNDIGNGDQEFVFTGRQTLKKGTYTLKGWVYIADGAALTIEPGTIIKGDKNTKASLIVERGGKLIAAGTAQQPIVFTSAQPKGQRKPGDWGGVILCGKAMNNQGEQQIEGGPRTKHGGQDNADNSGVLSYVRIEFAGNPYQKDREINALTLGSVGTGTQIDHIQVSYSNDDSFEWFGGTVNAKYLVAYKSWDDDFDTDNGYSGMVQFGLVVRDSKIADTSQSNGFESDNNASGSAVSPYTTATFSNMTFVGPMFDASFQNNPEYITAGEMFPNNSSALGKFQAAMHIRRNARLSCYNTIALGFPIGLILDNEKGNTQNAAMTGALKLNNIWFAGMGIVGSDANKYYQDALCIDYATKTYDTSRRSFSSTFFETQVGNRVSDNWNTLVASNGYTPLTGSALLTAGSTVGLDAWFKPVSYVGAFGASDSWLEGWTNFDPNNTDY